MFGGAAPPRTAAQRAFWDAWQKRRLAAYEHRRLKAKTQRDADELARGLAIEAKARAIVAEREEAERLARIQAEADKVARIEAQRIEDETARLAAEEWERTRPRTLQELVAGSFGEGLK